MKRQIAILCGLVMLCAGPGLRAETDEEVEAHKLVLDLAGAFSNDGFKLRDGHWTGVIKLRDHALIAVNLYSGNQYWFSTATKGKAVKISMDVFDESGKPITTENYDSGDRASVGFSPVNSGQYFISLGLVEGESATFCLVYSYK